MNSRGMRPPLYSCADARKLLAHLLDQGSFIEFCGPRERIANPHLAALNVPMSFDDGVAVGAGMLNGTEVYCAAQQGAFIGGAVGEIHGAKVTGLLERARERKPGAFLFLIDSGGVRLHEANAGLIGISEMMRALLDLRASGVPCIGMIGGREGAFGGMGILARCCDHVIMNEHGRLGMSGPGVIENVMGVEEFDAGDRAMIWRTYGGKHRYLIGEADCFVDDSLEAFRSAAAALMSARTQITAQSLGAGQRDLEGRYGAFRACTDAMEIWRALGIERPEEVQLLSTADFLRVAAGRKGVPAAPQGPMEAGREKEARSPAILARLFPAGHRCEVRRGVITGRAVCAGREIAVIGTTNHTTIDIPMSLRLSAHVLATVESAPGMPIVMLVDCAGQQLSREAELLGINGYFAHLLKCLHHARASGHHLVSVVYGKALSGAFLSFGLMGDQVYGITGSEVGVMKLSAMARVTKISERQLRRLGETSAVFAPGMENFMRLGGIQEIWPAEGEVEDRLAAALRVADRDDRRRALGAERGGRTLARMVAEKVKADVAREMSR